MKATCTSFINILNTIYERGITSKAMLLANQDLYTDFWFAVKDFCHYALLSKTSGKNSAGEVLPGNASKIDALMYRGATTREEIEMDCIIKIVEKLDLVLRQPIEKQKNYCYTICNNMVNDCFRKLPPDDIRIIPLNGTVESDVVVKEDSYTYEDIIGDDTYNGERIYMEHETINELSKKLKAKLAREEEEKRNAIINEIALLSKHPAEIMVRLACTHLGMKPRELSSLIIDKGCEVAYAEIIYAVSKKHNINIEDVRKIISNNKVTAKSVKADTNSKAAVAEQISRLVYRADKHLNK